MTDFYSDLAETLRGIAADISGLAGRGLPDAHVSISIQPRAEGDEQKILAIDAIGRAVMGTPGAPREMSGGGHHYHVEAQRGPIRVAAFDSIKSPAEREKDAEIERLQAELRAARGEPTDGAS
jgi:hypothetical protein